MSDFKIGASYYPEWWPESQWDDDFAKMADLGFNVVRMGEFAWSWYEPREGEFNFECFMFRGALRFCLELS